LGCIPLALMSLYLEAPATIPAAAAPAPSDDQLLPALNVDLTDAVYRARLAGVRVAARTFEHELRNVLAVTCGYTEMLATDESLPGDQRRRAAKANRSAREAARIIQQLVDVATSEEVDWGAYGRTLRVRD
jgi:signal transduction histidine kinase